MIGKPIELANIGYSFDGFKSPENLKQKKVIAPSEDRTHDLQIALSFRLWDWRATYCAIEAPIKSSLNLNLEIKNRLEKKNQTQKLISVYIIYI